MVGPFRADTTAELPRNRRPHESRFHSQKFARLLLPVDAANIMKSNVEEALAEIHDTARANCKHGHPPRTLGERKNRSKFVPAPLWFEYQIEKSAECWVWKGATFPSGYGMFWTGHRKEGTHRYAYELWRGPIPKGMLVCHKCDNKPCCNPDHLFLGTHADNMHDAQRKGLFIPGDHSGERNGGHKLTAGQVLEIRRSDAPTRLISEQYGIGYAAIQNIRAGRTWRNI